MENYVYKKELPKCSKTVNINISGELLPMQLIYTGTTDLCHPKVTFPSEFYIMHLHNHWSNKELVISLFKKIVILFIRKKRGALILVEDSKALLIRTKLLML